MKVIIDTERKQISIIGIITVEELNEFVAKHKFQDYVISAYELQPHFIPHNWHPEIPPYNPLLPPYEITCSDESKNFDRYLTVDSKRCMKIIGLREDDSRRIEPMTPDNLIK